MAEYKTPIAPIEPGVSFNYIRFFLCSVGLIIEEKAVLKHYDILKIDRILPIGIIVSAL